MRSSNERNCWPEPQRFISFSVPRCACWSERSKYGTTAGFPTISSSSAGVTALGYR